MSIRQEKKFNYKKIIKSANGQDSSINAGQQSQRAKAMEFHKIVHNFYVLGLYFLLFSTKLFRKYYQERKSQSGFQPICLFSRRFGE